MDNQASRGNIGFRLAERLRLRFIVDIAERRHEFGRGLCHC
ncbi:MAG TPA: hypothetical protein VN980_07760 [Alphaproteobacteria bacterium]|nr:hypothetical protein [Alphaproteobacteria bacterium]